MEIKDRYDDILIPQNIDYLENLKPAINLSLSEGLKLCWLASMAKFNIVEIGSYMGKSACFMAAGSRMGNRCQITCIEPWDLIDPNFDTRRPDRLATFAQADIKGHFDRQTRSYKDLIIAMYNNSEKVDVQAPVTYRDGRKGVVTTSIKVRGI